MPIFGTLSQRFWHRTTSLIVVASKPIVYELYECHPILTWALCTDVWKPHHWKTCKHWTKEKVTVLKNELNFSVGILMFFCSFVILLAVSRVPLEAILSFLNNSWQIPLLYHESTRQRMMPVGCSNFRPIGSPIIIRWLLGTTTVATTQKFRISTTTKSKSPLPKTDRINLVEQLHQNSRPI